MASLISKASLLMVPSVYEDGTLYNVLPSGNKAPDETGSHNGYDQTRADFTFSRGSNLSATRINSDGLIEKGRENLVLQSNQFDTTWSEAGSSGIITSGFEGYDGTNDAWQLEHKGSQYTSLRQTLSSSGVQTYSLYAKAGTLDYVVVYAQSSVSPKAWFNLSNGTIGTQQGSTIDASIESVGNGWYRCSIVFNDTLAGVRIYPNDGDGTYGTTAGTIYIQSAQLEKGLVSTPYIATGSTTATAGILEDMPRINYDANGENGALLLESSRTNLIENSEYIGGLDVGHTPTISIESETNPEGYSFTYKVTAVNTSSRVQDNIGTQGNNMVFSGFFKGVGTATRLRFRNNQGNQVQYNIDASGNFTLHSEDAANDNYGVEDYGNGWYRVYFETTTVNNADNYLQVYADSQNGTGSVYVWGLQVEAASYPSSYIPTHGAAVTRGADSMYVDYADAHPNDEGTIFFEVGNYETNSSASGFNKILVLNEVSSSNLDNVIYFEEYAGENTILIRKGGSTLLQSTPNYQDLRGSKIAIKWNSSEAKIFIDGSLNKTYTGDASLSPRYIGYDNPYNGQIVSSLVIKEQFHFNEALSDSECVTLTTL